MAWTFIIITLPLVYYMYIGVINYSRTNTLDDFFIYGRRMGTRNFTETFVATTLSLATEVTFFLSFGANSGLATLWAPVTFIAGTLIFIEIIKLFEAKDYGQQFISSGDTIIEFVRERTTASDARSEALPKLFSFLFVIISVVSLISIFVVELFIAAKVFSIFNMFNSVEGSFAIVTIFTCLVLLYVYMGGFRSVVDTDTIQLYLMAVGVLVLLGVGFYFAWTSGQYAIKHDLFSFSPDKLMKGDWTLALSFLTAFFAINFYRYISYIGSWQRILAVGKLSSVVQGMYGTIVGVVLFVAVLTFIGMIYSGFGADLGHYDAEVMLGYLKILLNMNSVVGNILLGIVIAGLMAALISTADSHIIAAVQTIAYDATKLLGLALSDRSIIGIARRSLGFVLAACLILYYVLVFKSDWGFSDLLFLFFSLQAVLAVSMLYVMFSKRPSPLNGIISIFVGIATYWTIVLLYKDVQALVFLNPSIIMVLEGLALLIGSYFTAPPRTARP